MDVFLCIVPLQHGDTQNSRRIASPFMRLVEGEERWEVPDHGILPQNRGGTKPNHTVTCMVLKATANDRRGISNGTNGNPKQVNVYTGFTISQTNSTECRFLTKLAIMVYGCTRKDEQRAQHIKAILPLLPVGIARNFHFFGVYA
ncbi:uncharacterized protein TNCV_993181 [Trichonephila clavipes]|nr:uncharacterized protein TNCV_993181 [Trichonephila clavipes]